LNLKRLLIVFALMTLVHSMSFAKEVKPVANLSQYKIKVLPVIKKYCVDCHGPDKKKGDVRLDTLNPDLFIGSDGGHWEEVLNQINIGEMPPKKKKQPSVQEREIITSWIQDEMRIASEFHKSTGGQVVMRRLTRYEYNYTLQDMLDVHVNHTKNMPQDQSNEHGLQNSGFLLGMNANQMESYMEVSDLALKKALWSAAKPTIFKKTVPSRLLVRERYPENIGGAYIEYKPEGVYLSPKAYGGSRHTAYDLSPRNKVTISTVGKIRISVKAGGLPDVDGKMPRLKVWIGFNADKNNWTKRLVDEVTLTSTPDKPKVYEFITEISEFPLPVVGPNAKGQLSAKGIMIFLGQGDEVYGGEAPPRITRLGGFKRMYRDKLYILNIQLREAKKNPKSKVKLVELEKKIKELSAKAKGSEKVNKRRSDLRLKSRKLNDSIRKKSVDIGKGKPRKKLSEPELEKLKKELIGVEKGRLDVEKELKRLDFKFYTWLKNQRRVFISSFEFESPYFETWPPKARTYLGSESAKASQRAQIAISKFAATAWRRPVKNEELKGYLKGFNEFYKESSDFDDSIKLTMGMVMASPNFLYLVEPSAKPRALTSHEVASRLSYFLWSSLPDSELRKAADSKSTLNSNDLQKQIERMLSDPKARRFAKHFTEQWLDSTRMEGVAVDPNYYPNFKVKTKEAMRREPIEYFWHVLTKNRSALEFIDSNYAVVDETLADHYKLKGVSGMAFRAVPVSKGDYRGGLLTMGNFMLGNSDGGHSNPIYRGKWLLEKLLNQGPPPPPPNVEAIIDESNSNFDKLPLKEKLAFHRENEACASCHNKLDPWGLALENFDAVGNWRTTDILIKEKAMAKLLAKPTAIKGKLVYEPIRQGVDVVVDATAKLPSGHKVNGVTELKSYLLKHKHHEFSEALVRTMFAYALGRSPEWTDKAEIERLTKTFTESDHKLKVLIVAIVNSKSFNER
jgi:hypothetical protein